MSTTQPTESISIRLATADDLPAINDIYNYYVAHSTCTYQEEPETIEARGAWFARRGPNHPVTVAVDAGGAVVGWASLSPYNLRSAYRFTVENSVYLRHDQCGRGLGARLLTDLIARARAIGHHTIIAGIDADQPASIALHRRFGFEPVAHLKEVGFKYDRWLDVLYLQLMLSPARGESPNP